LDVIGRHGPSRIQRGSNRFVSLNGNTDIDAAKADLPLLLPMPIILFQERLLLDVVAEVVATSHVVTVGSSPPSLPRACCCCCSFCCCCFGGGSKLAVVCCHGAPPPIKKKMIVNGKDACFATRARVDVHNEHVAPRSPPPSRGSVPDQLLSVCHFECPFFNGGEDAIFVVGG
jgi:hypothetical protein